MMSDILLCVNVDVYYYAHLDISFHWTGFELHSDRDLYPVVVL